MMLFHRRSERVKIFSETFVTEYLHKGASNNVHFKYTYTQLLETENSQEKNKVFNLVKIDCPRLKFNVFMPFDGYLNQ